MSNGYNKYVEPTLFELYNEVYKKERSRVVSRFYKKFGNVSVEVGEDLNFNQFKKEVEWIKSDNPKIALPELKRRIRNLVNKDQVYSMKQNNAVLLHLNEYLQMAWQQGAGRKSTAGRIGNSFALKPEKCSSEGLKELLNIVIRYKGVSAKWTDTKLQLKDVVGQSMYFKEIYDCVNILILGGNASELYAS